MVAMVLPSLKFAPPASGTESISAFVQAGSVAPAERFGALSTRRAVTVSAPAEGEIRPAVPHKTNPKIDVASSESPVWFRTSILILPYLAILMDIGSWW